MFKTRHGISLLIKGTERKKLEFRAVLEWKLCTWWSLLVVVLVVVVVGSTAICGRTNYVFGLKLGFDKIKVFIQVSKSNPS